MKLFNICDFLKFIISVDRIIMRRRHWVTASVTYVYILVSGYAIGLETRYKYHYIAGHVMMASN